MDRALVHRRLSAAGLPAAKADALTELLWNVHTTGRLADVDLVHLSDAGFRHLDVCIMRELLAAALNRPGAAPRATTPEVGEAAIGSLLGAIDRDDAG